jgi:hypothetical protein
MNTHSLSQVVPVRRMALMMLLAAGLLMSATSLAQVPVDKVPVDAVPVDENGNPVEAIDDSTVVSTVAVGNAETMPLPEPLSQAELQELVGPIALYPDDLLAIVLPASTYPLEIVQAARFLEDFERDNSLQPNDDWDDSVTALLNYPEVVELMNDDLDWTWQLGEAVVSQQAEVIAAVEAFRDRAYAAGNLKSDDRQVVRDNDGVIEIDPASEEIIYVPYYEPERVVVVQPRPVYYYHPRPYPVYYYPYPHGYNFYDNYFWGVTTAFSIGWATDHLHVFHHSYWGHPYYGRTYYGHWYRRPSITIYNTWYGNNRSSRSRDHYRDGDFWRPRDSGGARPGFNRSRAEHSRDRRRELSDDGYRNRVTADRTRTAQSGDRVAADTGIRFRERAAARAAANAQRNRGTVENRAAVRRETADRTAGGDDAIRFRPRERQPAANAGNRFRQNESQGNALVNRDVRPAARTQLERRQVQSQTRSAARATAPRSRSASPTRSAAPRVAPQATSRATPRATSRATPRATPRTAPRAATPRPAARTAPGASAPRATSKPSETARPASGNNNRDRNRNR